MRAILDLQLARLPELQGGGDADYLVPCLAILGLQRYDGSNVTSALTADNVEICSFNWFACSRCRLVRKSLQMSAMGRTTPFRARGRQGSGIAHCPHLARPSQPVDGDPTLWWKVGFKGRPNDRDHRKSHLLWAGVLCRVATHLARSASPDGPLWVKALNRFAIAR